MPLPTATSPDRALSSPSTANPTPAPAASGQSSTSTGPSASPPASTGSPEKVQHYLNLARQAFPGHDDAALVQQARALCDRLRTNTSAHDAVGELAGDLGSQATAKQLVDATAAAYCPGAADR